MCLSASLLDQEIPVNHYKGINIIKSTDLTVSSGFGAGVGELIFFESLYVSDTIPGDLRTSADND